MNYYQPNSYMNTYFPQGPMQAYQRPVGMEQNYMQQPVAGNATPNMAQNMAQPMQTTAQTNMQPIQTTYRGQATLQGKSVDSIDVVKATEIPLDGSVSYFPLTDNSAIITKQLMQDGTSKIVIYEPVEDKYEESKKVDYVTKEELDEVLKNNDNKEYIKGELKAFNKQIARLTEDLNDLKSRKD